VRAQMDTSDIAQIGPTMPARERILTTAYRLFTRRGVRAVGTDEVIAQSGVAKATLYRHFPSKNDLVLAVLQRREELWTLEMVEQQSRLRGGTPEEQLLAIFDVFHDWFQKHADFDGCSFINVLLEMGAAHPAGQASIRYLDNIRQILRERAEAAGLVDVDDFARSWHILMKGSIISATEGDLQAAHRAHSMGRSLIERHRQPADG
jgi:AcrR family transcriptional regulator